MCELNAATESHLKSAALCSLPKIGDCLSGPGGAMRNPCSMVSSCGEL